MSLLPFILNRATNSSLSTYYTKAEVDALVPTVTNPARNALAPRGGVAFDGTAGNRVTASLTGQNIGTDPFSAVLNIRVPNAVPSGSQGLFFLSSAPATSNVARGFFAEWRNDAGGVIQVTLLGAATSDSRTLRITNLVTNFAGREIQLALVRSGSTLTPYINGAPYLSTSEFTTGTPPSWADTITSSFLVIGSNSSGAESLVGTVRSFSLYNTALAQSDITEIFELGGAVPERFKFGSQVNRYPSGNSSSFGAADANSNPSGNSNGTSWSSVAGARTGGAGSWFWRVDSSSGYSDFIQWSLGMLNTANTYRVRFWARLNSGAAQNGVRVRFADQASTVFSDYTARQTFTASWAQYTYTLSRGNIPLSTALGSIWFSTQDIGPVYDFDDIEVTPIGAVVHLPLNDGAGLQLRDDSTNALHALMTTTGVTHVLPKPGGAFPLRTTTSTNGNQQLCGASCVPLNAQVLRVRARTRSGSATVSLGNVSGGAQIVSGASLTTTWSNLTIVGGAHITSTQNLWASSNSASVVEWDIELEELRV